MSGTDQLIDIRADEPEFYAELLSKISRPANRRLQPSGEQSCSDIPGIQDFDFALSRRLQTLLDAVADISLCQRGNVSATMASLKHYAVTDTLETKLYIVFDHENDDSAGYCDQHLQNIFTMLREVPDKTPETGGSPKDIADKLEDDCIGICTEIHNYSFDIFHHRVIKREGWLVNIRGYIEQDQTKFTDQERSTLLLFLSHVDMIIRSTKDEVSVSTTFIKMLSSMYSYWTHHDLLPKDSTADNRPTLLDRADIWLADHYHIGFQLRRWALKIMSFVISTNRLFIVTQSRRLSKIIKGNFSVQVLDSAIATPYSCHLSSESLQVALNATVAENHLPDDWDAKREWFITRVLGGPDETIDAFHRRATVHAELTMIIAMAEDDINVFPYIGVSKLSCTMCRHYIDAFNRIWGKTFVTKGSQAHGKAYPGWSWPSFPRRDDELLRVFLRGVRRQLLSDFEALAERERRLSDSIVGSGGAGFESVRTSDEIYNLYLATEQVRRGRGS